jgi:hypothetical protein
MAHVPGRTALRGPSLIRLLTRLTDAGSPEPAQPLADRLSQWLIWTDAVGLSAALGGQSPANALRVSMPDHAPEALCTRVRTSLANAIAKDGTLAPQRHRSHARNRPEQAAADTAPDYAAFRRCYLSLQEEMEAAIGNLRTLLREKLAARNPALARLASVDAVMERVLGIREHTALAAVPGLLAVHFERLRDAEAAKCDAAQAKPPNAGQHATPVATLATDSPPPAVKDGPWLDVFRKDMQSVLLAELEIRFQPVEGLRAALRAS